MKFTPVAAGHQARRHQTALRVAGLRVLDLDDVGAPLREDRARDRHERPRRDLDDPDPGQHFLHVVPLCLADFRARQ